MTPGASRVIRASASVIVAFVAVVRESNLVVVDQTVVAVGVDVGEQLQKLTHKSWNFRGNIHESTDFYFPRLICLRLGYSRVAMQGGAEDAGPAARHKRSSTIISLTTVHRRQKPAMASTYGIFRYS